MYYRAFKILVRVLNELKRRLSLYNVSAHSGVASQERVGELFILAFERRYEVA